MRMSSSLPSAQGQPPQHLQQRHPPHPPRLHRQARTVVLWADCAKKLTNCIIRRSILNSLTCHDPHHGLLDETRRRFLNIYMGPNFGFTACTAWSLWSLTLKQDGGSRRCTMLHWALKWLWNGRGYRSKILGEMMMMMILMMMMMFLFCFSLSESELKFSSHC